MISWIGAIHGRGVSRVQKDPIRVVDGWINVGALAGLGHSDKQALKIVPRPTVRADYGSPLPSCAKAVSVASRNPVCLDAASVRLAARSHQLRDLLGAE